MTEPTTLTSENETSPIRRIQLVDDDWAVVTVQSSEGEEIDYAVRRHGVAERLLPAV
jgi:hypothetical protein